MANRVFIAALLGLLLINPGGAFGGNNGLTPDRTVRKMTNPLAPEYGQSGAVPLQNHAQQYGRPAGTEPPLSASRLLSALTLPPVPKKCDTSYSTGGPDTYSIAVPYATMNRDMVAQRFRRTGPYATCTLEVAYIAVYPSECTGNPDLTVQIWDDALGYPGTVLGTVTIPNADLPTTSGYATVDFTSQNVVITGDFYVSIATPTPGARFATMVDDGTYGTGSSFVHQGSPQIWYTRTELEFVDYNYDFVVDKCCIDPTYSACYHLDHTGTPASVWNFPSTAGNRQWAGMKFSPLGGSDSLKDVYFWVYAIASGTPDINVAVLPSVAGVPDLSNPIYTTSLPYGNYTVGGNNTLTMPTGLLMRNDFFVVLGATGGYWQGVVDDGSTGTVSSWAYNNVTGVWQTLLASYGVDYNFFIGADLCIDPYSECLTVSQVMCAPHYLYGLPLTNGRIGVFQRVNARGGSSRLGKVRLPLDVLDAPGGGVSPAEVRVYSNDGDLGSPGTLLGTIAVTPPYPDWTTDGDFLEVDFSSQTIRFDGWIYIGIVTLQTGDTPVDFYCQADDGVCNSNQMYALFRAPATYNWAYYAGYNFLIEADICSFPEIPSICDPGESWPTAAHDFRRSAASYNSTADAKCKQTLKWWHTDAAGIAYTRPIIYDTMLIIAYNTKLQGFSINGHPSTPIWTIGALPYMGSSFRNSVTVKDGFLYFGGGSNKGFTKANVYTGGIYWSRNPVNNPLADATTYTTSVILNQSGSEVIYFTTAGGQVYALDAATGANWTGWATNPVQLDGNPFATLSADPSRNRIYVGTDGSLNANGYGTLYAIDAATGTVTWQDGMSVLRGVALDSTGTTEEFQAPIAVDYDGAIFTTTSFTIEAKSGTPSGVKYKINPDGTIVWAKGFKFGRYAGPVIGVNNVFMATLRGWSDEDQRVQAVSKINGNIIWLSDPAYDGMSWVEGALTCESGGKPFLLYQANQTYQFLAYNANTGLSEFEYNYAGNTSQNRGCGTAIDPDHVVFTNLKGDFFVMENTFNNRPRLRILKYDDIKTVPFFSPSHIYVTYSDVFMNNGCANLTGTLTASASPTSIIVTSVAQSRINRMAKLADQMVDNSYADMARSAMKAMPVDKLTLEADFQNSALSKDSYSDKAAYGPPSWLNNSGVSSFNLAPGATYNVHFDVNGPMVTRGPHYCYVTIASNDQYYLNSSAFPEVRLGVLGGCMTNYSRLIFGSTLQNYAPAMSTGEIGNQEDIPFMFDGSDSHHWQGGFFLMASKYRLAWTTDSWHGADPAHFWMSLLPDVNLCGDCAVHVTQSPVHLVDMSHDGGATYTPVSGYIAHQRYIDSVVNFNCFGTGWDWGNVTCPYDDTLSMGLAVNQWMYGVTGEASLNNVVIYRMDIVNRNAAPLNNVCLAAYNDFDLSSNKNDILKFDSAHSIAYGWSCNVPTATAVYGMGKIPYDKDPMLMSRTIDQAQAMWETNYIALDSLYLWSSTLTGETWQTGIQNGIGCTPITANDRAQYYTFMKHSFAGNETYKLGTYLFGYNSQDGTNSTTWTNLAILVNQFCGFGRGDISSDNLVNLADVVALLNYVNGTGHGPKFRHLADVNNSGGAPDVNDVIYLANYWFCAGPSPVGDWALPTICP